MEKLNDTKLAEVLKNIKVTPSADWSSKSEQHLLKIAIAQEKKPVDNSFFINKFMKNKLVIASVLFIALFVVGITAFTAYYLSISTNNPKFSKEETAAILAKVLANNTTSTFQESTSLAPARSADMSAKASSLTIAPIIDDFNGFNYRYTKTTVTQGPAANRCSNNFSYDKFNSITENYEYRPNGGADYKSYIYKGINYSADNQITNYTLSRYQGNNSIYFEYGGGQYAVKNVYEQGPDSITPVLLNDVAIPEATSSSENSKDSVTSNEPASENNDALVGQYFGPDAEIVSTIQENGNNYYILRYSYDLLCDGANTKIIYENKINQVSYIVTDTKTYLGTADAANLVNSTNVTIETKNITSEESAKIFNFEINVPVKEVVYPYIPAEEYSAEKEVQKTLDALKTQNTYVLFPQDYELSYGYAYIPVTAPVNSNYRADRKFYPSGSLGDEIFNLYNPTNNVYLETDSYWNFTKGDYTTNLYLESYKAGTTLAEIVNSKTQSYSEIKDKTTTNTQIKIDGVNVPATLISFKAKQNIVYFREGDLSASSSVSSGSASSGATATVENKIRAPESDEIDFNSELTYAFIIFEFRGHFYAAYKNAYDSNVINTSDLNLKSYNPNNSADLANVQAALLNIVHKPIPVDPGIGDGSSGTNPSDIACTEEAKQCPDGSYVGRNPKLNCEFDPCP